MIINNNARNNFFLKFVFLFFVLSASVFSSGISCKSLLPSQDGGSIASDLIGEQIQISLTVQSSILTGGDELLFDQAGVTSVVQVNDNQTEFPSFRDFSWDLNSNNKFIATNLGTFPDFLFGDTVYRYYVKFVNLQNKTITTVSLNPSTNVLNTTVSLIADNEFVITQTSDSPINSLSLFEVDLTVEAQNGQNQDEIDAYNACIDAKIDRIYARIAKKQARISKLQQRLDFLQNHPNPRKRDKAHQVSAKIAKNEARINDLEGKVLDLRDKQI